MRRTNPHVETRHGTSPPPRPQPTTDDDETEYVSLLPAIWLIKYMYSTIYFTNIDRKDYKTGQTINTSDLLNPNLDK